MEEVVSVESMIRLLVVGIGSRPPPGRRVWPTIGIRAVYKTRSRRALK